jgi:polyisoprenoid-binding protein YceI
MTTISLTTDLAAPEGLATGTWTIDPAHTSVSFSVRHLMSRVRGSFSDVTGQIVTDHSLPRCQVTATVVLASVHTGNPMRDDHLRSADFFDTAHTPQMTFRSTALRPAGTTADAGWVLTGDLTIRDVTRPVDLEVEFLGTDPDGLQGEPRIGFSARAAISRRDFGVTFGLAADGAKIFIGDKVDIVLDVQAFRST